VNISVSKEFLQKLLNYLDEKPHKEVRFFIDEILKCQPVQEGSKDGDKRKDEN
jgi:hypothetical protein